MLFSGWFSRISLSICCFSADASWFSWLFSVSERSITVRCGSLIASRVKISSGLSPHARIISLSASSLLTLVFGFMLSPDAMYMPLRYSVNEENGDGATFRQTACLIAHSRSGSAL